MEYKPLITLGNVNKSTTSVYVHILWEISRNSNGIKGYLGMPRDKKYRLIIDVGLLFGSTLKCLLRYGIKILIKALILLL